MTFILPPERYYHPDYNDLLRYFGINFQLGWCNSWDSKAGDDRSRTYSPYKDDDEFNRRTYVFCYQSIGLMVAGIHRPYIAKILEHTADRFVVTLLDVGSGGGQLGLAMHTLGFKVSFADLYSESVKFLAWRLADRRLDLPIYLLDYIDDRVTIPKHDIVTCFDVMEHLNSDDQRALIRRCAELGQAVFMNLITDERDIMDGIHVGVDVVDLTAYAHSLYPNLWWRDYYPDENGVFRQRLIIYGDGVKRAESETEGHRELTNAA